MNNNWSVTEKYWFASLILLFITSCSLQEDPAVERSARAKSEKGDIVIGAVAPWSSVNKLWEGIQLAAEEVNGSGGVLGRRLRIIKADDNSMVSKGQKIAQDFADNLDMVAVIGHYNSYISLPCSIIYEYNGLLMISPYSSSPALTDQGFQYIFRNTLNDEVSAEALALFCRKQGYKKVLIYHAKTEYGLSFANAFEHQSNSLAVTIVDRLSYDVLSDAADFRKDLKYWQEMYAFDAILLAGRTPAAGIFAREARNMGIRVPIVGGSGIDNENYLKNAGNGAENTFACTVFDPDDPRDEVRSFVKKFQDRYGFQPNKGSAQGYDTLMVLAQAIKTAGNGAPEEVGRALREMEDWHGIIDKSSFDSRGDMTAANVTIMKALRGKFEYFCNTEDLQQE